MGGDLPKQFLAIGGDSILARSIRVFDRLPEVGEIVVVVPPLHIRRAGMIVRRGMFRKVSAIVPGGASRQASVGAGLKAFARAPVVVLVHDAVRPFVRSGTVRAVISAAWRHGGAVAGVPVPDTIKVRNAKGFCRRTLDRTRLWAIQTPQGFRFDLLIRAHRAADRAGFIGTDEASLVERLRWPVRIVEGDHGNFKITTREHLQMAKSRLKARTR